MRIVEYQPEHFDSLRSAAASVGNRGLQHREFVNHYYASSRFCRLYLAVASNGAIAGTLGVETMLFQHQGRERRLGFGSNFHALKPGVGGLLLLQWLHSCEFGLVFGGTESSLRVFRTQNWTEYPRMPLWYLNRPFTPGAGESAWRVLAKKTAQRALRRPLEQYSRKLPACARDISVAEERQYSDNLLPSQSPFSFRFAPSRQYLAWRYALDLSFVRYRLFRILRGGRTEGYVVLNDQPRQILVSQCDGSDAGVLASGVLRAILKLGREGDPARTVMLASSHFQMQRLFHQFGFRIAATRAFLIGGLRKTAPDIGTETSRWLVNFDLGDNGLRSPFLDEQPEVARAARAVPDSPVRQPYAVDLD